MACAACANIFEPTDRALQLMRVFWDRKEDEVRAFLNEYEMVCSHLATAALEDSEGVEALESVSEIALPWDEAGEGKMLE